MKTLLTLGRLATAALVCALAVQATLAERIVTFKLEKGKKTFVVMTVIDHPDPVGIRAREGHDRLERSVNPGGRVRGDGPAAVSRGTDGYAAGVWAYRIGSGHDVAFSEYLDGRWTRPSFLTRGLIDEVDPKIHVRSDGTIFVVWWTPQDDQIYLATRLAGSTEWETVSVTAGADRGRNPSLVEFYGRIRVIFNRPRAGAGRDVIVVATPDENGGFGFNLVDPETRSVVLGTLGSGDGILGFGRAYGQTGTQGSGQGYGSDTQSPQTPADRSSGAVEAARKTHLSRR